MRKIDPFAAFLFGMFTAIMLLAAFAVAYASKPVLHVDIYQVTPEGLSMFLGSRDLPLESDVVSAIPGIDEMHCQLYFRDYNLNGIPEAPALLSCLDPEGGQHSIPVETEGMEKVHLET